MASRNPQSTAQIAGHPLHPMLIPFPVAFLVATLACDLIFWRTGNPAWATASLDLLGGRDISAAWHHMTGNVVAVLLSPLNWWRRYDAADAGAPVVPTGC